MFQTTEGKGNSVHWTNNSGDVVKASEVRSVDIDAVDAL